MKLKKNIGPKNRAARLIAGLLLLVAAAYYFDKSLFAGIVCIVAGTVLILESILSFCIVHGIRGTKDMR